MNKQSSQLTLFPFISPCFVGIKVYNNATRGSGWKISSFSVSLPPLDLHILNTENTLALCHLHNVRRAVWAVNYLSDLQISEVACFRLTQPEFMHMKNWQPNLVLLQTVLCCSVKKLVQSICCGLCCRFVDLLSCSVSPHHAILVCSCSVSCCLTGPETFAGWGMWTRSLLIYRSEETDPLKEKCF